ncbi:restriction endonuclease subunit S [Lactobacillus iners]|uniref:restriction endonuclease subunit S n=2 Tax=Lactobacillus iners TaxID=147802 RepID=UPI0013E1BB56|nr:restriction endonuclease subunit S [Lactobacillus iners]QIH22252.1 restriction endonuclease subunit S [Lactobacillus iners]
METWKKIRLGDACKTNMYSYSPKEKWNFVNYLDTGNITDNKIDSIQYIDVVNEKLPSRARRKVKKDSIIYSTVRPNQHHFGIIKSQPENFLVSTGFAVIDTDSQVLDADFLYYLLTQSTIVESLNAIAEQSTSAYPSIKPSDIENLEIEIPDIATQKKIADVLFSLDKKMAQNMEINKNLEQQAQAIYQQMFIDNPDPDWIEGSLSDIANITMGQSPSGSSYNEDGIGTIFFQGRAEFGFRFPTIRLYTTEPKRMAYANDILMSVRAPVGDLNVSHNDCCIGRGLAAIHSKTNHQSFVLYTMFSLKKQFNVFNGEGTVFGSINRNSLNDMPILIPDDEQIEKFELIVAPMDATIRNNYDEICCLQAVRDSLLPRLMSGELDVSDIDL